MSADEQQPTQPNPDFLKSAAPWAETFSKGVAGIAVALYASGFLTVSIYHSQFGFVGTNPFRPRILAAGAWFFLFTGIPVSIAAGFRRSSWRRIGRSAVGFWVMFAVLSVLVGSLVFDYTTDSRPIIHLPTWGWIAITVVWFLFVLTARPSKIPEWAAITVSLLLTSLYLVNPLGSLFKHQFNTLCLGLWFFGVATIAFAQFKIQNQDLTSFGGWTKLMGVLLGALLVFSQYVYPHLKASWGGGTPANVTIYFSKDSLLSPNKSVQAQLIEESDDGFYIVGAKESKAIFVPRSSVAMVYFSDKPADSPILQNNKLP